ncbi:hypothetical protein CKO32_07125 [Afifella marina DSM 2698]|nr:hypothetical protein [Afifella marina DSM 2698]MBK1626326.1 hypothetical protein [Afifella marina]MBK5917204.1 hypothetical protein [Afifella marina]RAI22177.1 hypothetical protein CH311_05640 [Afifella marina DSM 2698]
MPGRRIIGLRRLTAPRSRSDHLVKIGRGGALAFDLALIYKRACRIARLSAFGRIGHAVAIQKAHT